jgi:hypothetical protein
MKADTSKIRFPDTGITISPANTHLSAKNLMATFLKSASRLRQTCNAPRWLMAGLISLFISACGSGGSSISPSIGTDSGAENTEIPLSNTPNVQQPLTPYNGPVPNNEEVQRFKLSFWDNLRANNRCGSCHGSNGQSPTFVQDNDINQAFTVAESIVNKSAPSASRIVAKVAGGHNCWLGDDLACADIITTYITNWVAGSSSSANQIALRAPQLRNPGASKNFPADSSVFSNLHTLLLDHCAGCHSDTSAIPISPYFASSNITAAYEAAQSKIDLDTPASSRLVVRLRSEFHNCWSGSCNNDAAEIESAIQSLSDGISITEINPDLVTSKALTLPDGLVISGGGRIDTNTIAFYQFKSGSGNTIYDTSGIEPAINLTLTGSEGINYEWVGGWGIHMINSKAQGLTSSSRKLYDQITSVGEYSIEAWVAPGNVSQEGPAVIVGYSAGNNARNFTLGQTLYNYNFLNRSSETDGNGEPSVSTPDAAELLQATLQHVVVTFSPVNGRSLYINGELIDVDAADLTGGNLNDWDDTFAFVLGNETSNNRTWEGTLRLVAIHNRALTNAQIQQNFEAGVGERFYLLFNISEQINVAESYIVFEVTQFDSYSYLFSDPFYVSLDANADPVNIPLQGMRIGINGREARTGQAYVNLDITLDSSKQNSDSGFQYLIESTAVNTPQVASGTVIPLEKGPQADEFFLTFERLGNQSFAYVEADPETPPASTQELQQPDIGLRTFDEINATLAAITGVSPQQNQVKTTFTTVRQQLPTDENIEGFLSAHQMAITQLAIEYCNALIDDNTLRSNLFGSFDFGADANTISDSNWVSGLIDPLINAALGSDLSTQANAVSVRNELLTLITDTADIKPIGNPDLIPDGLAKCGGSCGSGRTEIVAKASCAAILGSAAMLIQ